jgi:hypothetical protein
MTPHQTLAVTVRMLALWLFLYCSITIFSSYLYANGQGARSSLFIPIALVALVTILCVLLWAFPLFVAKKILPVTTENPAKTPLFESWFSVGCSLIGLFALSKSIPALASYFITNFLALKLYPTTFQINPDWPLHVAFNFFQLLFGIWLFLGGKGLKKILLWARYA